MINRAEYLTVPEAATRLGVNEETVRRHIRASTLRAEKLGNQWFIRLSDLTDFSAHYDPHTGPTKREQ